MPGARGECRGDRFQVGSSPPASSGMKRDLVYARDHTVAEGLQTTIRFDLERSDASRPEHDVQHGCVLREGLERARVPAAGWQLLEVVIPSRSQRACVA